MSSTPYLDGYDLRNLTVGVLGGHSALDVCHGAKKYGFKTLAVARAGREKTFSKYFKTRKRGKSEVGCVDDVIEVEKFSDVLQEKLQKRLREQNTLFVHNRYFWVYFDDFSKVENDFHIPIFGSRTLLKLEERDQKFNQYDLLHAADIRTPEIYSSPDKIQLGRVAIVKVSEAARGYERAFFLTTADQFQMHADERIRRGQITADALAKATIEEYVIGAQVNFNFFYSPLTGELELLGTDTRRQTNLDGFLRMTGKDQEWALQCTPLKMIETGHVAVTVKESILEKAFEMGEKFVKATQNLPKELDPSGKGIIGPFALQGAVVAEEGREDIVIFDVSLRIPGSPGLRATPYSGYLHGESLSVGERIGMEIRAAADANALAQIVT